MVFMHQKQIKHQISIQFDIK